MSSGGAETGMIAGERRRAAIVGASGYVGGELLRLLDGHPWIDVVEATSERLRGRFVHSVHPNLRGRTSLRFKTFAELESVDVLFLCLPHGVAAGRLDELAAKASLIVDCSADFRLRSADLHVATYGEDPAPEWRPRFVYGLPEARREQLIGARYISGVGCNATAVNLALLPLALAGWIERGWIDRVVADVKVGSSEGGAEASASSHHPERSGALRSFAPVGHRHQAEIHEQTGLPAESLFFSATAVEAVRGVLATCHVFLNRAVEEKELWAIYRGAYGGESFVRLVNEKRGLHRLPDPKVLAGSNYCDVGWRLDGGGGDGGRGASRGESRGRRLVVLSAIDNLVKGAAGSAVQSVNLALGFDESAGLSFPGLHPC